MEEATQDHESSVVGKESKDQPAYVSVMAVMAGLVGLTMFGMVVRRRQRLRDDLYQDRHASLILIDLPAEESNHHDLEGIMLVANETCLAENGIAA